MLLRRSVVVGLLSLATPITAATHRAFVGNEGGPDVLYTLEFDDELLTLELLRNNSLPAASGWLALSVFQGDKKTLYSTNMGDISGSQPYLVSYSVDEDANLEYSGGLSGGSGRGLGVWAGARPIPPYEVHLAYLTAQSVVSVSANGSLVGETQNLTFGGSYLHGGAFHPNSKYLYTFDVDVDTIWTHEIDDTTGDITYVANSSVPDPVSGPRHGVVHPNGKYLYIVTETSNHVAQFTIDNATGIPTFDNVYFSLLGVGQNNSNYWSAEVNLSPSNSFLWATRRGRSSEYLGAVGLHTLNEEGSMEKQNFLIDTSTSGGLSNLVQPTLFSDRWVALPDLEQGFVEMWELAQDNSTATVIAHLDLADGGCCENLVWLN
ncbi:hypothetical protein PFICI_11298 [Pestalotiopsis fici W106-1]|uniref:Carboxy-cis,cis-muconate cyclase n=1 Tax=Pestalotiopsis fici (strain W106-1 / CGMCC3.15140) TaxID=1229662 RepID=W3WUE4_PESFW|nr:uncharacterized protein PFICI_11298 [Pestalotiopsis fici W106-1]ETS77424.1 hypothetical protein PFICI_11298 [Pestalotiopsis fici W106-1]